MNTFQEQCAILAAVCLAASLFFFGVMRSSRTTWFSAVISSNLLALALIFGTFASIELGGERAEIAAALVSELPFVAVVSCLCLAQAGYLPGRARVTPLAVVASRPRLRLLLAGAGSVLPAAWLVAAIFGFIRPSPAVQALAPAPVEFFIFKCILMVPPMFFAGLAAALFLSAAGSGSLDARLRLKNVAFACATSCLAMVALESTVFAGARVWLPDQARVTAIGSLLTIETSLAIVCVSSFIVGLALRYTPAITLLSVRHMATRWLPEQDLFDSYKWRAVIGGATRGVVIASYRIGIAANLLGLSRSDTERAIGTVQHIAAMRDGASDVDSVTLERARDLHGMQAEVVKDSDLVRKIGEIESPGITPRLGAAHAASLHVELEAALDLMNHDPAAHEGYDDRPLWFCLAAVGASDVGLVDASVVTAILADEARFGRVLEAYAEATSSGARGHGHQHHGRSPKTQT